MAAHRADPKAAERRKKRIAIGLGLLFVAVLAFQVPRTLKLLSGSGSSEASPATTAPGTTSNAPGSTATVPGTPTANVAAPTSAPVGGGLPVNSDVPPTPGGSQLASLDRFGANDPFVQQVSPLESAPEAPAPETTAPQVAPPVPATPTPLRPARRLSRTARYAVVLQALPVSYGRGAAGQEAGRARRAGLGRIGVLESAEYSSMRAGYYVVFSGVYRSLAGSRAAERGARAGGFRGAYTHQLAR